MVALALPNPIDERAFNVKLFNLQGGAQIRWNDDLQEYVTVAGDRFCKGDVEDRIAQIKRQADLQQ